MRVPMIARWPGVIPAGTTSPAIGMNIDFLPTLAALAKVDLPDDRPIDGHDLLPVLRGEDGSGHEYLLLYDGKDIAGVRSQEWKLVQRAWYRILNTAIGGERYYYYPGLLFDMTREGEELYSMTREHPDVAAQHRLWADTAEKAIVPEEFE